MIPDTGSDWTHMAKRDGFWRCNGTTGNGGNELVMGAIGKVGKVYTYKFCYSSCPSKLYSPNISEQFKRFES